MDEELTIADELGSLGIDEFIEHLPEFNEISGDEVIMQARNFKNSYKQYFDFHESILITVKGKKRIKPSSKKQLQELQDQAYKDFFLFQNSFNEYFKNRIQMVAVIAINGERQLRLIDNNFDELTRNKYGGLIYNMKQVGQQLKYDSDIYDNTLLEAVTDEVFFRWDVALATHNSSQHLPILWYLNGKWSGAKVTNKGSISEAYANFYINKYDKFTSPGASHLNVKIFVTEGVGAVDNTSGFAIGDVSYKNVQFGIKSTDASPMKMRQVYLEIENLINMITSGIERTPETLREYLPNSLKTAWTVQAKELTAEQIGEELDNLFSKFGDIFY